MDWTYLAWAFLAGSVATINPCGIAMLPAYISYYLGQNNSNHLLRGLLGGLLLSAGTFSAFIIMGIIITVLGTTISRYIPWLALLIAIFLLLSGLMTLLDHAPSLNINFTAKTPNTKLYGFFGFGLAYGFASLGCTLPIFMILISSALSSNFIKGFMAFVAYGFGMGLVLTGVSFAVALGKTAVLRWLKILSPVLKYIGGFGLLFAGSYLLYYNLKGISFMLTAKHSNLALYIAIIAFVLSVLSWLYLRNPSKDLNKLN